MKVRLLAPLLGVLLALVAVAAEASPTAPPKVIGTVAISGGAEVVAFEQPNRLIAAKGKMSYVADPASLQVTRKTLNMCMSPRQAAVDPARHIAYFTDNYVQCRQARGMDTNTGELTAIAKAAGEPVGITINPTTNRLYVSTGGLLYAYDTTKIDITSLKGEVGQLAIGRNTLGVSVNPNTNIVYLGTQDGVFAINGDTMVSLGQVGTTPVTYATGVAVNSQTNTLWVTNYTPKQLIGIDLATGQTRYTIKVPGFGPTLGVAVDAVRNRVYVESGDTIFFVDGATGEIVDKIKVPGLSGTSRTLIGRLAVGPTGTLYVGTTRGIAVIEEVLDTTAPTTTVTLSAQPNAAGWYRGDVTLKLAAKDGEGGSGATEIVVAATGAGEFPQRSITGSSGSVLVDAEGITTVTVSARDLAGNVEPVQSFTVRIDRSLPTISGAATTEPNADGWYRGSVTVHFTCSDETSGIASCPTDEQIAREGRNLSTSGTAVDVAGNKASVTVGGVNVDATTPVSKAAISPAANAAGWHGGPVSVTLSATDAAAGVAAIWYGVDGGPVQGYGAPFTVSTDGPHTISYYAADKAGNVEAEHTLSLNIDDRNPSIDVVLTGTLGDNGWYVSPVTAAFTCADAGSGIVACPAAQSASDDGSYSFKGETQDKAGNKAGATANARIDRTAPTSTAKTDPAPQPDGWNSGPVNVTITALDNGAGIAAIKYSLDGGEWLFYGGAVPVRDSGEHVIRFYAVDKAGNRETERSHSVKIDSGTPTIRLILSGTPGSNGWWVSPVTGTFVCDDADAPIVSCPGPVSYSDDGIFTVKGETRDAVGNVTTLTQTVKIDRGAPTTTATVSPEPTTSGWHNAAVKVILAATDKGSGVGSIKYSLDGGPWLTYSSPLSISADGAHTLKFFAVDNAGNAEAEQTRAIKIDDTNPTLRVSLAGTVGTNGWYVSSVTGTFICEDAGSGIASCPAPATVSADGTQTIKGEAKDAAGNAGSVTASAKIDKTKPVIEFKNNKGTYGIHETLAIDCVATDATSGILSENCEDAKGPAYTYGAGAETLTGRATDKAGNVGEGSTTFTVTTTGGNICELTKKFVTKAGVANSMCSKLNAAEAAYLREGNNIGSRQLDAYRQEVSVQTGKSVTAANAAILRQLALELKERREAGRFD